MTPYVMNILMYKTIRISVLRQTVYKYSAYVV